ncbi:MAG: hypothetical protein WCD47_19260 [Candidatus Sulfotelmatobacter sp.]
MANHCSIGHDLYYKLARNHWDFEKNEDVPPELFDVKKYRDCLAELDDHFWKGPQCAVAEYAYLKDDALKVFLN